MKNVILLMAVLFLVFEDSLRAQGDIIFDNSSTQGQSSSGLGPSTGAQTGHAATISTTANTEISEFDALIMMQAAGNIQFVILSNSTHAILYQSDPVFFDIEVERTWKQSPELTFTLQAGQSYDIGYVSDTSTEAFFGAQAFNQDGISSANTAVYLDGFGSTAAFSYDLGNRDPDIRLIGAIPEPSSFVLLALSAIAAPCCWRLTQRKKQRENPISANSSAGRKNPVGSCTTSPA